MMRAFDTVIIAAAAGMALQAPAPSQAQSPTQPQPQSQSASLTPEPLKHESASFDLVVKAPLAETERLFGPDGERAWAGRTWNPQFFYPQPAHDEAGAVFRIEHGPYSAVWVVTQFDSEAGHYQYVYQMQNLMVATIDVRFKSIDPEKTAVNVVYARTAVSPEGNEHVSTMSQGDRVAGPKWQEAIDKYLATRKTGKKP